MRRPWLCLFILFPYPFTLDLCRMHLQSTPVNYSPLLTRFEYFPYFSLSSPSRSMSHEKKNPMVFGNGSLFECTCMLHSKEFWCCFLSGRVKNPVKWILRILSLHLVGRDWKGRGDSTKGPSRRGKSGFASWQRHHTSRTGSCLQHAQKSPFAVSIARDEAVDLLIDC